MNAAAEVYFDGVLAGYLCKNAPRGYSFFYVRAYLQNPSSLPIAFAFPLGEAAFHSQGLFPFFEGLVSEGWLKEKQSVLQKIDENDVFSLLINNGEDLVGAVSLKKIAPESAYGILQDLLEKN